MEVFLIDGEFAILPAWDSLCCEGSMDTSWFHKTIQCKRLGFLAALILSWALGGARAQSKQQECTRKQGKPPHPPAARVPPSPRGEGFWCLPVHDSLSLGRGLG